MEALAIGLQHSDGGFAAAELRIDLKQALARLSERERQVLQLHHIDGLLVAECVALMGLGVDNTKKILKKALRALRESPGMDAYQVIGTTQQEVRK